MHRFRTGCFVQAVAYLRNGFFQGRPLPQLSSLSRLVLVDDVQTALVVVIPFLAAAMARGLWLY